MFGTLSGGFWLALLAVWGVRKVLLAHYQYRMWRLVRTAVVLAFIAGLVRRGVARVVWLGMAGHNQRPLPGAEELRAVGMQAHTPAVPPDSRLPGRPAPHPATPARSASSSSCPRP